MIPETYTNDEGEEFVAAPMIGGCGKEHEDVCHGCAFQGDSEACADAPDCVLSDIIWIKAQ